MIISAAAFLILFAATVAVFFVAFIEALSSRGFSWISPLILLIFAALVFGHFNEWFRGVIKADRKPRWRIRDIYDSIAVLGGALAVFLLTAEFGVAPVAAAGFAAVASCLLLPQYNAPIYGGAFVGMACGACVASYGHLVLAALFACLLRVASKNIFTGLGGKSAAVVFAGIAAASIIGGYQLGGDSVPRPNTGYYMLLYAVLAVLLTGALRFRVKHDSIMSSGIVSLAAGLILPAAYPDIGGILAVTVMAASLIAMSERSRLPNELHLAAAAAFCAAVFMCSAPYFGKLECKPGIVAFGSVVAFSGMRKAAGLIMKVVFRYFRQSPS